MVVQGLLSEPTGYSITVKAPQLIMLNVKASQKVGGALGSQLASKQIESLEGGEAFTVLIQLHFYTKKIVYLCFSYFRD